MTMQVQDQAATGEEEVRDPWVPPDVGQEPAGTEVASEAAPAPDPIAELRAELAAAKADLLAEKETLRRQAEQPKLEEARAAAVAARDQLARDLEVLALPREEIDRRVATFEAGQQYIENFPALTNMAVTAWTRDMARRMLPKNATMQDFDEFEQHIAQYGLDHRLMDAAAKQWIEGRRSRTTAVQAANAEARAASGAERTEGAAGGYTPGMSSRDRYVKALKEGGPLPSKQEIDRITAGYLR